MYTTNIPIIFMDVDGVLNSHDFDQDAQSNPIHREKVELVNEIIRATGARIVLSSAWRYHIFRGEMTLDGINWLFRSHGLMAGPPDEEGNPTNRIIGVTPPDTMIDNPMISNSKCLVKGQPVKIPVSDERGWQIFHWRFLNSHVGRYVVIDDGGKRDDGSWTDMGIKKEGHPFIRTDSERGMQGHNADLAIVRLGRL